MPERGDICVGAKHFAETVTIGLDHGRMTVEPALCRKMLCPYMAYSALQPDLRR
jgi:hypothetical protein